MLPDPEEMTGNKQQTSEINAMQDRFDDLRKLEVEYNRTLKQLKYSEENRILHSRHCVFIKEF